jgi:threonine dehydratase
VPIDYVKRILRARVYEVARETPLDPAPLLSQRCGNQVYLKREDLQPVFSFKLRGAYNKIAGLAEDERARGVIAASAGNHAQGVALAATRLGVPALIVMPKTTPSIKVDAVRRRGGEVVLHGNVYDDAFAHARELAADRGLAFIPPYDDPDVIAGQGTVAVEIMRQHPGGLHAIFVPVGGGGLLAGVSAYVKAFWPEVRVIGVESDESPSMHQALAAGERVILDQVGIFADGVAVRQAGAEPFRICRETVDQVVVVSGDEVCAAIKDIFEDTRSIAEPAGALGVAGLKKYVAENGLTGASLVAIDSGANMNFERLRYVAERTATGEQREALLAVTIPERPGSFRAFCHAVGPRAITEFNYRYAHAGDAKVFVGVELREGEADRQRLVAHLEDKGYPVTDLSDSELAKLHVRYMVGGRSEQVGDEVVYRFQFPERPGALLRFLSRMGDQWNISLFHYRTLGAAYGRVLAGFQVPPAAMGDFARFLRELGYPYWEETANPAYQAFLRFGG